MSINQIGRNRSEVITSNDGRVFKKCMLGSTADVTRRYNNLIVWDQLAKEYESINTPVIVAADSKTKCIEYEYIESSVNSADVSPTYDGENNQIKNLDLLQTTFDILVKIHSINFSDIHNDAHIPIFDIWRGISVVKEVSIETFIMASGAELELIRFLQNEKYIKEGCLKLYGERELAKARQVVSHGDFRPDQIINTNSKVYVIDFEELCLAHAEFDIASYCASIVFLAIRNTLSKTNDNYTEEEVDNFIVTNISNALDTCFTKFKQLISFYENRVGYALSNTLLNLEFAWAILERIFSYSKFSFSLSSIDRAIMGIAQQIFINPEQKLLKEAI